jgi:hypothetical protein
MKITSYLMLTAGFLGCALWAKADVLELKNGTMLNGKYVGGSAGTVRFETSAGVQVIETAQAPHAQRTFTMKPISHLSARTALTRGLAVASLALSLVFGASAQPAEGTVTVVLQPDPANLRAFIELVRSDLRTDKALIIAQNIRFTEEEAAEFWPLHREYELARNKFLDERLALINKYLGLHDSMTDDQARKLADKAFALEEKQTKLKRTYFKRFAKVVPAKKAAQFFQLENQINAALDVRLAAALPLIK